MSGYIALVHKDEGTSYGVSFPDVPGCISAGDTLDEALTNASEALAGHFALMRADGDAIPTARGLEEIRADAEIADEFIGALVRVVIPAQLSANKRGSSADAFRDRISPESRDSTGRSAGRISVPEGGERAGGLYRSAISGRFVSAKSTPPHTTVKESSSKRTDGGSKGKRQK